ncbi:hypothetical protein WI36_14295 [Burkholderia ubonensis]|nr:hypothetical protein WI36_14295 [Burkholderia ubonensis]
MPRRGQDDLFFDVHVLQVERGIFVDCRAQLRIGRFADLFAPRQLVLDVPQQRFALHVLRLEFVDDFVQRLRAAAQARKQIPILVGVMDLLRILADVVQHGPEHHQPRHRPAGGEPLDEVLHARDDGRQLPMLPENDLYRAPWLWGSHFTHLPPCVRHGNVPVSVTRRLRRA